MTDTPKDESAQDFATFILDLNYGQVNAEASNLLAEITAAVMEHAKPGTLTIKIKVDKQGDMAVATSEVVSKVPQATIPPTSFFFGKDGRSLTREDPRQMTFRQLGEVESPRQFRAINGGNENDQD